MPTSADRAGRTRARHAGPGVPTTPTRWRAPTVSAWAGPPARSSGGKDSIGDVCGLIQRSRPTFTSHILSKYTDVQKFHNKDNLASAIPPADTPRRPRRRRTFRHRAPPVRPNRPPFPPWEPSSRTIPPITCSAGTQSTPPILFAPSTSTVPAGMPIAPRGRGAGLAISATSGITSRSRRGDT